MKPTNISSVKLVLFTQPTVNKDLVMINNIAGSVGMCPSGIKYRKIDLPKSTARKVLAGVGVKYFKKLFNKGLLSKPLAEILFESSTNISSISVFSKLFSAAMLVW